jgi:hypothetical protein
MLGQVTAVLFLAGIALISASALRLRLRKGTISDRIRQGFWLYRLGFALFTLSIPLCVLRSVQ